MNYVTCFFKLASLIFTGLLVMSVPAQASEEIEFGKTELTFQVDKDINKIIDKVVTNKKGEELGKIETMLMTNPDSLQYAVISVGGFLGIGDKLVAVPLRNLEITTDGGVRINNVTKKDLEKAPAFDYKKAGIINRRFPQYGPDQH